MAHHQGGRCGGGTREQCGSVGSLKNLTGDEGGGCGGAWGGQGGRWGTGFLFWAPLKPNNWLVTRVGDGGRRGEVAHGGRARGERGGGAPEARWGDGGRRGEVAHGGRARGTKGALLPPFALPNLTTGLIWLVTRVGGWGEAWGGGPWRAGKGGDGVGPPESSVGATKVHWFTF